MLILVSGRWIVSKLCKVVEVVVVCGCTVTAGFVMIYFIDDCKAIGQDTIEYPIQASSFIYSSFFLTLF